MELRVLWEQAIRKVEGKLPPHDLSCWVAAIEPRERRGNDVVGVVPSRVHLEQARHRVAPELRAALSEILGAPSDLVLSVSRPPSVRRAPARLARPRFSSEYTFERFVTGSSNAFASRSARQVADKPGALYNPLFLCGGVGLGKTHLATAIANTVSAADPMTRVAFLSAESFSNDLIRAFRTNSTEEFRGRFRRADVLVIDDVQFFAGKERMQEEFFHTFNALYTMRKQIVLASDQPPRDIPNLEQRLRSRFESGLIADIHPPDLALRLAILGQKAKAIGFSLPADVADLVAKKVISSIRELEGALHRLVAACQVSDRVLDLGFAMQILRPIVRTPPPRTVEQVQRLVAARFQVSEQDLVCRGRASGVLLPRQVAMYLARKGTAATYAEIAAGFGNRNHTTVIHAVKAVEQRRAAEPELAAILEHLETELAGC